jgi:hypothetical protein
MRIAIEQQNRESPSPLYTQFDGSFSERTVNISTSTANTLNPNHLKAPPDRFPSTSSPSSSSSAPNRILDVIEFEAVEYLCFETDQFIEIAVTREGSNLGPLVLVWNTVDIAAGRTYSKLSGEIKFEKGEKRSTFKMEVVWRFQEFSVESLMDVTLKFKFANEATIHSILGGINKFGRKKKEKISYN